MTMSTTVLRIGTRASALARVQTGQVAAALGVPVEIVPIVTVGDRSAAALTQIGGTGVFVSALREALLDGRIDAAVHSYKDLPTVPAEGIVVAAVPTREDPREALVARGGLSVGQLPMGARVGTGSPRRTAQLRALGLGLEIVPVRGNIDTRLAKVARGDLDAVVLALAGLMRLGRAAEISQVLDPIQLLPAPAQGALAIECRAGDNAACSALSALDDAGSRATVTAERALLAALQGGCAAPIGALAVITNDCTGRPELLLRANVTAADGSTAIWLSAAGAPAAAEEVGARLAADLLARGAGQLMDTMCTLPSQAPASSGRQRLSHAIDQLESPQVRDALSTVEACARSTHSMA
jgi:hydroxymethylbilane synthase